jgi:hypothetical protein
LLVLTGCAAKPSLPLGVYTITITLEDNIGYDTAGTWLLTLAEGNRYSFTYFAFVFAEGRYSLTRDQIAFTDEGGPYPCKGPSEETGTYKWALDEKALILTTVEDQCVVRNVILTAHPWSKQD